MSLNLVTGGTGFIGGHLAAALAAAGERVRLLARPGRSIELPGEFEIARGDLTRLETLAPAFAGVARVYHCAAQINPAGFSAAGYRAVNVAGTAAVLEAARRAGAGRLVHVSSVAVLGPVGPEPAAEDAPYAPTDIYETAKAEAEQLALAASGGGLEVVVARPAWVYGPGDRRTLKLIGRVAGRRMVMIGAGRTQNSPVHVADVAAGLAACGRTAGIAGRIYHLTGPAPAAVAEIIAAIARAAGVPPPRIRLPVWLMRLAAGACEAAWSPLGREPPFDRRKLGFFTLPRVYSGARARAELGYEPRIGLDEGMAQTVGWYRDHGWLR